MSDKGDADARRKVAPILSSAREPAIGAPDRTADATPALGPGKTTLVQGAAPPVPPFKSVLALIEQRTDALARAIETLNYFDAWSVSLDLQRAIAYAEGQLQMVNAAERAIAAGELRRLAEAAQQQIARSPSPSKAAVQEVTAVKDRHAARPTWDAEKRAWLAAHGGGAGARSAGASAAESAPGGELTRSGKSTHAGAPGAVPSHDVAAGGTSSHATDQGAGHAPVAAAKASAPSSGAASSPAQRAPAGAAPPDLGNYDSPVGKRVLVLRSWDDTTIAARRVELQGRLSRTTEPKARDELLTEYQAIEWVAHERGLALPKDPGEEAAPQAYSGGKPIKYWVPETAQGTRAMLEREMAAGSGYESAREHAQQRIGYGTLPQSETNNDKRLIGDQQIALMDHDAAAFRGAFQIEAKQTALSMLDASTAAIDSALRSYGIAAGSFRLTDAAHKVARDPSVLDAEVDKWVALSSRLDDNRAAQAAGHGKREDLAREAKQLRDLQDSIAALAAEQLRLMKLQQAQHPEHPGMPRPAKQPDWRAVEARSAQLRPMQGAAAQPQNPFAQRSAPAAEAPEHQLEFVRGALRVRQAQFQAAWIQAERQHPVLAAYRGTKAPDASSLSDLGGDEATTRSIVHHVLPKLGHIYRTKAALLGSWGTLDPLQLAPAVELTKQRMFVAQGSTRDRVVHDMAVQAHDKGGLAQWALEAVMIGLTLVTLVPTAGASAAAGLALTGLAYDLYMGMGEYEEFQVMSAAADTDLDKLRSLSDLEPSLTPLLTRIVSAGINLTIAAGLFKRAVGLRRMAMSGKVDPEALVELNKAGEAAGAKNVGDEAIAATRAEAGATAPRSAADASAERGEQPKSHPEREAGPEERKASSEPPHKIASEVPRGRDLPEFPVAKDTLVADNDEKGNHFAVVFSASAFDGQEIPLGEAVVQLASDGGAADLPWLNLKATARRDGQDYAVHIFDSVTPRGGLPPTPVGDRTSLTEYALRTFMARYKARFGHEPTAFFGQLIESNRENFQREYVRLLSGGMKPNAAKVEAVRRISFGKHRMALGYTEFEVELEGSATVDLGGELGVRKNVPTSIEVTARKP